VRHAPVGGVSGRYPTHWGVGPRVRSDVVRVYVEVARRAFRRFATYRGATGAALFTNVVFGIFLTSVVGAVARQRGGAIGGLDEAGLVTQIWLGQGMIAVVDVFVRHPELVERIRSGDVVIDLYRPIDLQAWWAAVDAGRAAYELLVRFVPPVTIGIVFFGARLPAGRDVPAVVLALVLAVSVSYALRFLAYSSGFWLIDARGAVRTLMTVWIVGAGMTIPLPLLPDAIELPLRALPFASTIQLVSDVWTGTARPSLPASLALQATWAVVLLSAGRVVQARATRKVVVQGG
jgi:ABC-2 type transport system permease protein